MSSLWERAEEWSEVALANIVREFPHVEIVYLDSPDQRPPRPKEAHPSFYGALDWHSSVEMHWVLIALLRRVPRALDETRIRLLLNEHFSSEALRTETANLPGSERPYGLAWAFTLAEELASLSEDEEASRWLANMAPLLERAASVFSRWIEISGYPVRTGMHSNTAFAFSRALSYARRRHPELALAIETAAERFYSRDVDYPGRYEPSATDFLSPALTEAELMSQLLAEESFPAWLEGFLPGLAKQEPGELFSPVSVSDPSDGHVAHLHGLNLSRAWCWTRLAAALPIEDPRREPMREAARRHRESSIDEVRGSHYMVEHWLAAYAVLLAKAEDVL